MARLLIFALACSVPLTGEAAQRPIEFWRSIVQQKYQPPDGSDVQALTIELADLLASPDPELRDDIAYSTFVAWIYQKRLVDVPTMQRLSAQLLANLRYHIGGQESDDVFRRSFSALTLGVIAARDNAAPFLSEPEYRRIADAALLYLADEHDLRGYEPEKGWMHSAAHTADLLKFLARGRYVTPADQQRILDGVGAKLLRAGTVLTHGEDERFARTLLSIVNRADFDAPAFTTWVARTKPARPAARPSAADLSGAQNIKNLFAKLEVLLTLDPQPSPGVESARDALRQALKDLY